MSRARGVVSRNGTTMSDDATSQEVSPNTTTVGIALRLRGNVE